MKTIQQFMFLVALACVGCAGTGSGSSSGGSSGTPAVTVQMTGGHAFNPINVTVPAGSIVQWKNVDTARHTVASDTNVAGMNSDPAFGSGLPGGATFNWTIPSGATSGTVFFYHCEIHGAAGNGTSFGSGMVGSVTVQ